MRVDGPTLAKSVVLLMPAFKQAAITILPPNLHDRRVRVSSLIDRGKRAAHDIDFHWRTQYAATVSLTDGIHFRGQVDLVGDRFVPSLQAVFPSGRPVYLELPKARVSRMRFVAFQTFLHETIHLRQFAHRMDVQGNQNCRVYGTSEYRQIAAEGSAHRMNEMVYFSDHDEIEAYASCIALEWVCWCRDTTWRQFLQKWRNTPADASAYSRFTSYAWYMHYFGDAWGVHPVLRRLRKKVREFADVYREQPCLRRRAFSDPEDVRA